MRKTKNPAGRRGASLELFFLVTVLPLAFSGPVRTSSRLGRNVEVSSSSTAECDECVVSASASDVREAVQTEEVSLNASFANFTNGDLERAWNFLANLTVVDDSGNESVCGNSAAFLFCRAFSSCGDSQDEECSTVHQQARNTVCGEIRYIRGLLSPLTANDLGTLKTWLTHLEDRICPARMDYNTCVVRSAFGQYAFQHRCPSPLQTTRNEKRMSKDFQEEILEAEGMYFDPDEENAVYGQMFELYPCGDSCELVKKDDIRTKLVIATARIGGVLLLVLPVITLIACFRFGMRKMLRYPYRLQLYLAGAVFVFGLFLQPHAFLSVGGTDVHCNADGTERTGSLKDNGVCVFTFMMSVGGGMMFQLVTLMVVFAWWQLVLSLQMKKTWYAIKVQGKVEALWIVLSLTWSVTVVLVQFFDSEPLAAFISINFCITLYKGSQFISYSPYVIFLAAALAMIVDGLRRMRTVRRKSRIMRRKSGVYHRVSADRTIIAMVHRLRSYAIGLFLIALAEVFFQLVEKPGSVEHEVFAQRKVFRKCMVRSCGDLSLCEKEMPRLPVRRVTINMLFDICSIVLAFLLCSWAFQWKVWKGSSRNNLLHMARQTLTLPAVLIGTKDRTLSSGLAFENPAANSLDRNSVNKLSPSSPD